VSARRSYVTVLFSLRPAPPALYTLSLHDALPICSFPPRHRHNATARSARRCGRHAAAPRARVSTISHSASFPPRPGTISSFRRRSEEHTSELQSRSDLVCRLLLEKKKNNKTKQLR